MTNNFSSLNREAEAELLTKVMLRLSQERHLRSLRRRLLLMSLALISLCLIVVPVWDNFWLDWQRSGLIDYLSLLSSDARLVMANWQNYSLGFLESLPALSTASILVVFLTALVVIKSALKYGQEFEDYKYKSVQVYK